MIDIDRSKLYGRIKSIADRLVAEEKHFTRADLAYELQDEGIRGDSSDVGRLVWEAYQALGKDLAIRETFVDNGSRKSLVDSYRLVALIESSEERQAVDLVSQLMAQGRRAIEQVLRQVDEAGRPFRPERKSPLAQRAVDTIVGTAGVKAISEESTDLLRRYTSLVESYRQAKGQIKEAITSFGELREQVLYDYRKWVALLKDLFGDSIRSVAPEVFDFDKLRWLDVEQMYAETSLAFDSLSGRSTELLGTISESFHAHLKEGARDYSHASDRRAGLVMAAVDLVSHYADSVGSTAQLKGQLADLRQDVTRDATAIRADMARLVEVYRTLNDVYLTEADLFYRYGDKVFTSEWASLRDTLYSTPELRQVEQEREALYRRLRELEELMLDAKLQITYYKGQVRSTEALLTSLEEPYRKAAKAKPSEPGALHRAVTFGKAREKYNRRLAEWAKYGGAIVRQYEDARVDQKIYGEEITSLKRVYDESLKEYHKTRMDAGELTDHIHELQSLSPELLRRAAGQLTPVIKLLSVAREIIESRLDERLMTPQPISEPETLELPAEVTERIETLRRRLSEVKETAADVAVDRAQRAMRCPEVSMPKPPAAIVSQSPAPATDDAARSARMSEVVAARARVAAQRSAAALDELILLRKKEMENKLTEEHYRRELDRIRQTFQTNMRQLDDKSAFVSEVRRRVHTAETDEELRDNLLLLGGDGPRDLTAEDLRKLLLGEKTMEV